jgi:hypothetical protein
MKAVRIKDVLRQKTNKNGEHISAKKGRNVTDVVKRIWLQCHCRTFFPPTYSSSPFFQLLFLVHRLDDRDELITS